MDIDILADCMCYNKRLFWKNLLYIYLKKYKSMGINIKIHSMDITIPFNFKTNLSLLNEIFEVNTCLKEKFLNGGKEFKKLFRLIQNQKASNSTIRGYINAINSYPLDFLINLEEGELIINILKNSTSELQLDVYDENFLEIREVLMAKKINNRINQASKNVIITGSSHVFRGEEKSSLLKKINSVNSSLPMISVFFGFNYDDEIVPIGSSDIKIKSVYGIDFWVSSLSGR